MACAPISAPQPTRRSTRIQVQTNDFLTSVAQQNMNFEPQTIAFSSYYETLHEDDCLLQDQMADPIAFSATTSKDTLHYHQAMKADDKGQFQQAMNKEFNDHLDKKHYEVVSRDLVPEGESILDSVWAMKRKKIS